MPLRLVRRPKSPFWVLRGTVRRVRVEESTGVTSRPVAEEIRAKREAEIIAASVHGRSATATFAEACASYLETGGRRRTGGSRRFMGPVLDYFGTKPLSRIWLAEIEAGAKATYPKASPATRNRQFFTPTVAVLRHAAQRGLCPMPLIARPTQDQTVPRWLTPNEAERLIGCTSGHLRPLVIFLLYTGARAGEAVWLDWRDVDLARGHVTFRKTKNGEARGVPLHPRVVAALANLKHKVGEVFRKPSGQPYERPKRPDDTSAGRRIRTAFDGAVRRAGLEDFTPHDCRHTWATWHYARNRDLGALQKLGGWKSIAMVMRYTHVNVGELAHTIERLPGGNLGDTEIKSAESA